MILLIKIKLQKLHIVKPYTHLSGTLQTPCRQLTDTSYTLTDS